MRIGMGYDVHRLVEDRDLIMGGVTIPYEKLNAWHNMEFYFSGFTATPQAIWQAFSLSVECYIDDLKIERVEDRAFISQLTPSSSGGMSKQCSIGSSR